MSTINNRVGQRFGRLVVLSRAENKVYAGKIKPCWLCQCDCGEQRIVMACNLQKGDSTSCGCYRSELNRARALHGESHRAKNLEYISWCSMNARCQNPRSTQWQFYGGRGITICERWSSYENFLADMGRRPTPKHSLDRINTEGPYAPENCRWATFSEQCNNRRSNRLLTFNGKTQTVTMWARELGVNQNRIFRRLRAGLSVEQTLTDLALMSEALACLITITTEQGTTGSMNLAKVRRGA